MISFQDLAREIGTRVAKFDPPAHARRLTAVLQIAGCAPLATMHKTKSLTTTKRSDSRTSSLLYLI